jgi:hypothetical protein
MGNPLGLLAHLPGHWVGSGFNLIARPDRQNGNPFFLELNATTEHLDFVSLGGEVANRGSEQGDIDLFGVRYLQQVNDPVNGKIHVEPGLWMHVPASTDPAISETYVRLANIPHGDSLLAQSNLIVPNAPNGVPIINPVVSTPFTGDVPAINDPPANPETNPAYLAPYTTTPLPAGLPAGLDPVQTIHDPTLVLKAQIADQLADNRIEETIVIGISTTAPGNIVNIPFVVRNANAAQMDAIFWIELVKRPHGLHRFLQLQYVQRVILDFPPVPGGPIIRWPHISVATLVKQ